MDAICSYCKEEHGYLGIAPTRSIFLPPTLEKREMMWICPSCHARHKEEEERRKERAEKARGGLSFAEGEERGMLSFSVGGEISLVKKE